MGLETNRQGSRAIKNKVRGSVLVTERVTTDDDGLVPAWNQPRDIRDDDGLAEDHSTENVTNRSVGASPHLLEAKLFDARLIRCDGGALHANSVLLDGVSSIDRDLVIGLIPLLDSQVVVLEAEIEVRVNEAVLDGLPNNARHFVAIEFYDDTVNLDFLHGESLLSEPARRAMSDGVSQCAVYIFT